MSKGERCLNGVKFLVEYGMMRMEAGHHAKIQSRTCGGSVRDSGIKFIRYI